jgi:hypothetical protein
MIRRLLLTASLLALELASAGPALAASGTPSGTSASPSPAAGDGRISPATIVFALVLLGGLYLARRRMERGAGR